MIEYNIKIEIASDIDFNKLIAEIYINDKYFCLISQENGVDSLELINPNYNKNSNIIRNIPIKILNKSIKLAIEKLIKFK